MKRLQTKMLLLILLPTVLFFVGLGVYISYTVHTMTTSEAVKMLETEGNLLAEDLTLELETSSIAAQTLSKSFEGLLENELAPTRDQANVMLQQFLTNNPNALTTWMLWEKNSFDGKDAQYANTLGHDKTGRFIPVWGKDSSGNLFVEPIVDYDTPGELKDNFDAVFQTGESSIFEPFSYNVDGQDILMTTILSPIKVNGKTVGMTGVDISLEALNEKINALTFYETGFAGLLTNSGNVLAHQDSDLIGNNYFDSTAMTGRSDTEEVRKSVIVGEQKMISGFSDLLQKDVYRLFTPIHINGIQTPWSAFLAIPVKEVTQESVALTKTIIIVSSVIVLILAAIILFVTRSITKVLRSAVEHGQVMAEGDFTGHIPEGFLKRKDELGDLVRIFVALRKSMRGLIGKVKDSAELVAESASSVDIRTTESTLAANEVTASIERVAQAAEIQMQSAEESAKAMNDMAHGVQTVAHTASIVSDTTNELIGQASQGQKVVENAVLQMDTIKKGTNETKVVIEQLGVGANKIQKIVSVITAISEQTNLLALNAAIESARAGEFGKGFAVVAAEVRKLADETNVSAGDIQQLVFAIQTDSVKASESMELNESGADEGIKRMQEVTAAFTQIIASVELIVKEAIELSAVAEEMSAGSEEIAATSEEMASSAEVSYEQTHQVAAASEQQLASMEEIVTSSQTLKQLASDLNKELQQFKV